MIFFLVNVNNEFYVFFIGLFYFGLVVKFFEKVIYCWIVFFNVGFIFQDFVCFIWMYFFVVDLIRDINFGLVGFLLVCKVGVLGVDGKQVLLGFLVGKFGWKG